MAKRKGKSKVRQMPLSGRGDWGYYFFQDSGVSVVYVAKINEDGSVDAALFGIDTWRDGLIICHGRRFETKEAFEETVNHRSSYIKPAVRYRCREEIAYGLRIRLEAKADLPPEFSQWRNLVEPLDDIRLLSSIYRCPECGRGLSEPYVQTILDGIDSEVHFYFLCESCKYRLAGKSVEHAGLKHRLAFESIEEIDEFSFTWDQDNLSALIKLPVKPVYVDAVKKMISEGDNMRAACMAIESHIAHASVPNQIVEDQHVRAALQAVINGESSTEDEVSESDPVSFLTEAIQNGIEMFTDAMRRKGPWEPHLRIALREVITSVGNHRSKKDPRAYINFINRFFPV